MNPVALYFASGESLYSGAGVLLVVMIITPLIRNRWLVRLRNLAAWVGAAMVVMACAPFSWWVYGVLGLAFVAWFVAWNAGKEPLPRWVRVLRGVATPALAMLLVVGASLEMVHRTMPWLSGPIHDHLVVIGDSISAGIDPRQPSWPMVLRQAGFEVTNLAQPGAEVADSLGMAKKLTARDTLVLVEIGGNDLIADVPTEEFGRGLEALLSRIEAPGRVVVMFELPLLPHKIGYGRVQRALAAKYHVTLIPKRLFIQVLAGPGATSDGLHLSPVGAARMAELVGRILSPVLEPAATSRIRASQPASRGNTAE